MATEFNHRRLQLSAARVAQLGTLVMILTPLVGLALGLAAGGAAGRGFDGIEPIVGAAVGAVAGLFGGFVWGSLLSVAAEATLALGEVARATVEESIQRRVG